MQLLRYFPEKNLHLVLALSLGIVHFLVNPFQLEWQANQVVSIALCMVYLWITEAIPMPVVALVPIIAFPLIGILKMEEVTSGFSNPIIFLFMGGFFISLAIEKWGLHKRIALHIVKITGTSGNRMILGFIIATSFLSMWLSNTATTMMMFPIALSVIEVIKHSSVSEKQYTNFALVLMVVIAYASNFGGNATIIGTPPNVAFVAFLKTKYQIEFSFFQWFIVCAPLTIVILILLYIISTQLLYPNHIKKNPEVETYINAELKRLGKASKNEKRVFYIFLITALLWILKDLINKMLSIKLDDSMIAIFGGILLFVLPSTDKNEGLLTWKDTQHLAWGILLLFGGGIALAQALENAGILKLIGAQLSIISTFGLPVLIFSIALISIFLSELMSNIAQVIVLSPIVGEIAIQNNINPILLGLPMTLAASCASMLPMGTPPNTIVFSSGLIPLKKMLRLGLILNITCIIIISLFCIYVLPKII